LAVLILVVLDVLDLDLDFVSAILVFLRQFFSVLDFIFLSELFRFSKILYRFSI